MFSVGMACYDDFNGVYFTVQNQLAHHGKLINEIIVIDNNPGSPQGEMTKNFCASAPVNKVRYVAYTDKKGTAAPRNEVFKEARSEYVVCLDSHIVLMPRAFEALAEYIAAHPGTDDLIQGPLLYDNFIGISTHFDDVWRGEMWGVWSFDERYDDPDIKWFEIPAQGLGLFCAKKSTWLGFNEQFEGFGGEEWYIHEKYRQAHRRTICVKGLLWQHRFGRPSGVPYPLTRYDKLRNYFIGHHELKLSTERLEEHFRDKVTGEEMEKAKAHTPRADCGCGGAKPKARTVLDWADSVAKEPSDINEHVGALRELAARCPVVVDCGTRYNVSTIALAAGVQSMGGELHVVALTEPAEINQLRKLQTKVKWIAGDSLTADIPICDMLFLDTIHTADHVWRELNRLAPSVRRYIVLHDTISFGQVGEDGQPGLLSAVHAFITAHPEWTVIKHYHNNNGLLVLSQDQRDKKQPPPVHKLATKFAKAVALHVINNPHEVEKGVYAERLATCQVCELRNGEVCGECGCNIEAKTKLAGEQCPVNKWLAVSAQRTIVRRTRWHFLKNVLSVFLNRIIKRKS